MKKKVMKFMIVIASCLCMAAVFFVSSAVDPAHADERAYNVYTFSGTYKYTESLTLVHGGTMGKFVYLDMSKKVKKPKKFKKIITATSSDPNVVRVNDYEYTPNVDLYLESPGTATLTIKAKIKKKTKEYKTTVTVIPYENPLESLKLGDIDFTDYFKDQYIGTYRFKKDQTGALRVTPKAGWEVTGIIYKLISMDPERNSVKKNINNGAPITLFGTNDDGRYEFGGVSASVCINVVNSESGVMFTLYLNEYDDGDLFT